MAVPVSVGVRVRVGGIVQVGESVQVGVAVAGRVPVTVAVFVAVGLAECVGVNGVAGVRVGVEVGGSEPVLVGVVIEGVVGVGVPVRVAIDVAVRVGLVVRVGVLVVVGVGVDTGRSPIRITMESIAPTLPPSSRTRACTVVSPGGKLLSRSARKQNWTRRGSDDTNVAVPKSSIVHAVVRFALARKTHPRSLRALETSWVREKSFGLSAGTPRFVHTEESPSPNGADTCTCKSGRLWASCGSKLKTPLPTDDPLGPGTASTTTWNPEPAVRW